MLVLALCLVYCIVNISMSHLRILGKFLFSDKISPKETRNKHCSYKINNTVEYKLQWSGRLTFAVGRSCHFEHLAHALGYTSLPVVT